MSAMMARLAQAVRVAGELTNGLVDATLVDEIEAAGYAADRGGADPAGAGARARAAAAAGGRPALTRAGRASRWTSRGASSRARPGVKLDSGGLAKGLFADVLAERLVQSRELRGRLRRRPVDRRRRRRHARGRGRRARSTGARCTRSSCGGPASPPAASGGAAGWTTTGVPPTICWTPRPAGRRSRAIVQVTALAPSALIAEIHAKAALLSGPRRRAAWLPRGGVIVFDDGSHEVIAPPRRSHAQPALRLRAARWQPGLSGWMT